MEAGVTSDLQEVGFGRPFVPESEVVEDQEKERIQFQASIGGPTSAHLESVAKQRFSILKKIDQLKDH